MRFASNNNEIRKKIQDYSYGLNDLIGKGFSSSVFRGINERTREQVAIKVIDLRSIRDRSKKQMLEGEIQALKKLNHINIMRCFDIYSTQNNCYIITEFCNEGDLQNLLKKRQKLPQNQAIPIFRDVVNGFRAIAQNNFLHRDLKPANILIKDKVAKIADFGFAKKVTNNPKDDVNVGSPLYMSPESLKFNIYTIKNDIWSLGIILYEMLHGKTPWKVRDQDDLKEKMTKQTFTISSNLSEDLKDLIRKCLISEESKRLGVHEFYNHPFVVRITQDDGIPQLLRKQTSVLEKDPKEQPFNKQVMQNFETNSQNPTSLHHRRNPKMQQNKSEKQLNCQLNYMRFLYRFIGMFPPVECSGRFTLGLRFLATKQMLSQLFSLKKAFKKENLFNFDNWDEFLANEDRVKKYEEILESYEKKYEKEEQQLIKEIKIIGKDKTITSVVDTNFKRSEALSIFSLNYAIAECKALLNELKKLGPESFTQEQSRKGIRLDYTITFYQLNSMLIDNFHNLDFFTQHSKVELIIDNKPAPLDFGNIKELEQKMIALEIIR